MLREAKVGLLTLAALVVFAAAIFLIGDRQQLFSRKTGYVIHFTNAAGLSRGGSVQLNGVNVGTVTAVRLPEEPAKESITVEIRVDRHYEVHIREDSLARIKTLGLLGDKYVEITAGSPESPRIPGGGEISAAPATDVDKLMASGEDLLDNVLAMSVSLRNILARMERGEGLLGELTAGSDEGGSEMRHSLESTLTSLDSLLKKIDEGEGTLGLLFNDAGLAQRVEGAVGELETAVSAFESGPGVLPALLHDEELKERFVALVDGLEGTTREVNALMTEMREGEGLLKKLLTDEEYGRRVSEDLERMMENLSLVSEKLNSGDGTIAQLVNDPTVVEALNDILVGVDKSKFLRWLIRNRQKSGIKERYENEVEAMEEAGVEPPPLEPSDPGGGR